MGEVTAVQHVACAPARVTPTQIDARNPADYGEISMTPESSRPPLVRRAFVCAVMLALAFSAACSDSTTEAPPPPPQTSEITVDASTATAYVRLGDPSVVVPAAAPDLASGPYDLAFFGTSVRLGTGVAAFCLCANANGTVSQLQAMTPANQLAAFDAVGAADIPASSSFAADGIIRAVNGWVAGAGTAATVVPNRSWIIRRTSGASVVLGKFRVTTIAGATTSDAGRVTVEYAVQPSPGAPFGPVSTSTLDVSKAVPEFVSVELNLSSGPVSNGTGELSFQGYEIIVSPGVTALLDPSTPFAQITADYAATAPAVAFRSDTPGGVFTTSPWYRYNITGTDNQIWPNFNVYLIRRNTLFYKVQITGYYGPNGAPRQVTVRSAPIQ